MQQNVAVGYIFFASRDATLTLLMCHRYKLDSPNWWCQLLPCFKGKLNLVR